MRIIKWSCSVCNEGGEIEYSASLKGESTEIISAYIQGIHRARSPRCARKMRNFQDAAKKISWEIRKV